MSAVAKRDEENGGLKADLGEAGPSSKGSALMKPPGTRRPSGYPVSSDLGLVRGILKHCLRRPLDAPQEAQTGPKKPGPRKSELAGPFAYVDPKSVNGWPKHAGHRTSEVIQCSYSKVSVILGHCKLAPRRTCWRLESAPLP